MAEMWNTFRIKKTQTTALHPQSDSMVKRMNKTLEDHFSKFVNDHQHNWDHYLLFMMMALCSATNESTKCTPAILQLEQELRLPVDLLMGHAEELTSARNYNERLLQTLEKVHNFAQNNLHLSSDQMKSHYDVRVDDKTF